MTEAHVTKQYNLVPAMQWAVMPRGWWHYGRQKTVYLGRSYPDWHLHRHVWFDACCVDIVFIILVRCRMTCEAKTAKRLRCRIVILLARCTSKAS